MDEIAEAIGSLRAGLDAIARRQDAMQIERATQHTEAITRMTDVQAQAHEIKHTQNNDAVKFARIEQVVAGHAVMLAAHQQMSEAGMKKLEDQLLANRDAADTRDVAIRERIDDLFAWRNKVYGIVAVVVLGLTLFGKDIWAGIVHLARKVIV
jgi:hypothetical protein